MHMYMLKVGVQPTKILYLWSIILYMNNVYAYGSRVLSTPSREGVTLVAVNEQGQLVGFVDGGRARHSDPEYQAELNAIYLLEEVQGHGLGRRLVQALVEQFLQMGYQSMMLWVFTQNPACRFYEALGGIHIKTALDTIGGASYEEIAYGWRDIRILL